MISIIDLRVALVALACLVASAGLATLTFWFWRNARLESPVLAPLEVMSERRFKKASEDRRQVLLDEVRGLATVVATVPQKRAAQSRVVTTIEHVDEEPIADEPYEELGYGGEAVAPIIDPLLGRRGN